MIPEKNPLQNEQVKTDLKHDTMEFSAPTDGDDKLDADDEGYEEEGISADELDFLDEDSIDNQAEALVVAETDREGDEDNLPEEDWLKDIEDVNTEDDVSLMDEVDVKEPDTAANRDSGTRDTI